jgi:phosphoserine phosphatase
MQHRARFRLVVFDLDGTILEAESSWATLNRSFGSECSETMECFRRGEIDYAEFMRRDIARWPFPLHISRVRNALAGWSLRPGAEAVIAALRERGLELAILTGGVSVLAEEVASRLGIGELLANELVTDERGFLTGEARLHVDPLRKELALARMCWALGTPREACVTVGDSDWDRSFLHAGGLGILVGDARRGEALGVPSVTELGGLLALVDARS